MQIQTGLLSHMVLQRNEHDQSAAKITGTTKKSGTFHARVTKNDKALKNISFTVTETKSSGAFAGVLTGVPVGGPYDVTLTVADANGKIVDTTSVKDVLVGDVWILAGQSNMQGIGHMKDTLKPDPMTRAFYVTDTWGVAKDPLHQLHLAVDDVHTKVLGAGKDAPHVGVGPGLAFAQEMRKLYDVPQGLIAAAHGGTTMDQWDPALKSEGGASLYGAMLRRFHKNGSNVAGVLWYQGCSDTSDVTAPVYTKKMIAFVKAVRKDFKDATLPFGVVQISRVCGGILSSPVHWNSVQDQQRLLPKSIKHLFVVPAIDLALDDGIHISGFDQIRLGKRLAQAMATLKFKNPEYLPPIALKSIKSVPNMQSGWTDVVLTFDNVMGALQSLGRPAGFEIAENLEFLSNHLIYRIDLSGNKVILKTSIPYTESANRFLHYGYGVHPYCNITDAFDRSLPVMGPVPLRSTGTFSPFANKLLVSDFQPSAGKLDGLQYPRKHADLNFKAIQFPANFCSLHDAIALHAPEDHVVYYKFNLMSTEALDLKLDLGYDGPVKVWLDGAEILHDPKGINPALPDEKKVSFTTKQGANEFLIALGTNHGLAWGVFIRFEHPIPKAAETLELARILSFQL